MRSLEALRRGDAEAVPELIGKLSDSEPPWALHWYLAARSYLDRDAPDGRAALEALEQAASAPSEGTQLPLATARLRAHRLLPGEGGPAAAAITEARDELERLEGLAATDLSSLFLVRLARDDLAVSSHGNPARPSGEE